MAYAVASEMMDAYELKRHVEVCMYVCMVRRVRSDVCMYVCRRGRKT